MPVEEKGEERDEQILRFKKIHINDKQSSLFFNLERSLGRNKNRFSIILIRCML